MKPRRRRACQRQPRAVTEHCSRIPTGEKPAAGELREEWMPAAA